MKRSFRHLLMICSGVALVAGCRGEAPPPAPAAPGGDSAEPARVPTRDISVSPLNEEEARPGGDMFMSPRVAPPTWAETPPRLVGIGDLHGDIVATRNVLKMIAVMDEEDHWIGGDAVVVQVGDQLDRGDSEREILHLLESLSQEAEAAGGAVYILLGNHETMNVELDLRYVTAGGFTDFADVAHDATDPLYAGYEPSEVGRVAAFRPGGPYATLLSGHNTIMVVGDTVFVHGGVLPSHVTYGLETINGEIQAWMRGDAPRPSSVSSDTSPVWSRHYSDSPDWEDCLLLFETLDALGLTRMVVAHTVQTQGITAACEDKVWRIDVGLASYYGGLPAALEIVGGEVKVLQEDP